MANKKIKGLTVEIGGDTTKLGKALDNIEKKGRNLSSELGEINRLLKLDPGNTDLLAQKQKVLAEAVSNTRDKLDKLKDAEKQVQKQFERGEVSEEQVRALQREIVATETALGKYESAAKDTAEAIDKLGREAEDAAEGLDDTAENADKAKDASNELGSSLDGTLSTGLKAVTALAAGAAAALIGCAESSHEYRREMGKLDTAFTTSGFSSEAATKTYKELQGVLGETDQAVEAANHLAELADTEEDLAHWTGDILPGVFAKFGASLPLEGLTEAVNETIKVGKVTGSLADALNWASKESGIWDDVLKDNQKSMKAFKKAVADGEAVEDAFSAALAECSDEQERQQIITKTLTKLYGGASKQYKETNKEVIRSNQANEEWNATLASIGETVAPVVTDIKLFGTELAKNAEEPLKRVAKYIRTTVLPSLTSMSDWALSNLPKIGSAVVGVTATLVAYKVATIATEVAHKGLKGAIMATTVAQKALNLAQAATPWGLAAAAIAGVITAMVAYSVQAKEAAENVDVLTEEERELMKAADETAQAFRDQQAATAENIGGITSQMGHVQSLAQELQTLASASGKVKETDEARVQFILNELNEALGTEYTMTDGVVQKYGELKKNIDAVIQSKTANALIEANNADYVAALQAEEQALQDLVLSEKDYQAQLEIATEAERIAKEARAELNEKVAAGKEASDWRELQSEANRVTNLEIQAGLEKNLLEEKEKAYNDSAANYGNYSDTIMTYEEAQTAALEGNYDKAVKLLKSKGVKFGDYADDVDEATSQAIDALFKEAIDAGLAAERTKKNFEAGVDGYTKDMVDEAEKGYEDALDAYATAYTDAHGVGTDMGDGLKDGMESKRSSLLAKARNLVSSIIGAFRSEADSHSPSRKMISFGEDMGEGADIGLENKTKDLLNTAEDQVNSLMDVYHKGFDPNGQAVANTIQRRNSMQQSQVYQKAADGTLGKLDKILQAIEKGQILAIDGEIFVGATVDQYDRKLGQKRNLTARGAL